MNHKAKNLRDPNEADLGAYEAGFGDGYEDYRNNLECDYFLDEDGTIMDYRGVMNTPVNQADAWYAYGVIRGYEQAREDDK